MNYKIITIKKIYFLGLLTTIFLASLTNLHAQISVVVSKSSVQKANANEIKEIFSAARLTWPNGSKISVVDQSDTETGKNFYSTFLQKTTGQVRMQWTKLVLSGQATAPVKAGDDDAVKKSLSNNPNSIGYISTKSLDGSVKELFRIE